MLSRFILIDKRSCRCHERRRRSLRWRAEPSPLLSCASSLHDFTRLGFHKGHTTKKTLEQNTLQMLAPRDNVENAHDASTMRLSARQCDAYAREHDVVQNQRCVQTAGSHVRFLSVDACAGHLYRFLKKEWSNLECLTLDIARVTCPKRSTPQKIERGGVFATVCLSIGVRPILAMLAALRRDDMPRQVRCKRISTTSSQDALICFQR